MLILGIDPSTDKTGICLREVVDEGQRTLWTRTADYKTPTAQAMWIAVVGFMGMEDIPDRIVIEGAFVGPQIRHAGIQIARAGAWAEAILAHHYPNVKAVLPMATTWRRKVWGSDKMRMKTDQAKAYSLLFAKGHGVEVASDHESDAFCLTFYEE